MTTTNHTSPSGEDAANGAMPASYDAWLRQERSRRADFTPLADSWARSAWKACVALTAANGAIGDVEKAIDKLIYTAWYSGEQDGSEGVAWSERGDSYNGMLRDRIQDDKRALLAALTAANVAMGEREASVEPLAWYVEWEVGAETWVDAFANESTAIDKGRLHNGKVIPCYPSAPDVVAISQGAALDAADALETEYLRVANGQIKPAKMSLEPLVRAVQAIRDLRATLTAEKVAAQEPVGEVTATVLEGADQGVIGWYGDPLPVKSVLYAAPPLPEESGVDQGDGGKSSPS